MSEKKVYLCDRCLLARPIDDEYVYCYGNKISKAEDNGNQYDCWTFKPKADRLSSRVKVVFE